MQRPLFRARENRQSTSYNLSFLQSYIQIEVLLDVIRGWRSLGYYVLVNRSHFISIWAIRAVVIRVTDIQFVEKDHSLSMW